MKSLIPEFDTQSFTQIIFPHQNTDWEYCLEDAKQNFIAIINAIIKYQKCLVVCDDLQKVKSYFEENENLFFVEFETNDTWARDCSALCILDNGEVKLTNFIFNAWGGKFEATKDNLISKAISKHYSAPMIDYDFILEGGGVESNGEGVILTTSACLLNKNRNASMDSIQVTQKLGETLGAEKVLYLEHGYLAGDDTDSHIDTLARFVDARTIMYVKPPHKEDEHYEELYAMEQELHQMAQENNFKLIALPFPSAKYEEDERLPATYANFLFVNGAVLVPTYSVPEDAEALEIFAKTFPTKDIVPIECSTLIRQHGSLHCVTMNFAAGVSIC
jgi:agmatine/peptidylarginine deiminase